MNKLLRVLPLLCMLFTILTAIGMLLWMPATKAEPQCLPDLHKINAALEDVQRIRVGSEEQGSLLRDIRDQLRKARQGDLPKTR
jgi:hypothetical protein